MYGDPDEVEVTSKHAIHVLMQSRTPTWTYERTASLWDEVSRAVAGTRALSEGDSKTLGARRWWRWGTEEARAYRSVADGIAAALRTSGFQSHDASPSKAWADHVMIHPSVVESPGQLERVLALLYDVAAETAGVGFHASYEGELARVQHGDARRSLADVGSMRDWLGREPAEMLAYTTYPLVVAGIKKACAECSIRL